VREAVLAGFASCVGLHEELDCIRWLPKPDREDWR
jgi:hypothetical protein